MNDMFSIGLGLAGAFSRSIGECCRACEAARGRAATGAGVGRAGAAI